MKSYLLDTSAFLRYLLHDIPAQSDTIAQIFRRAKQGECRVTLPLVVFFEATYTLATYYKLKRDEIKDRCEAFLTTPYLDIPDRQALLLGYQTWVENRSLSFADAVLMQTAKLGDQELLTFDKKLAKLAKTSKI